MERRSEINEAPADLPRTRRAAIAAGAPKYFTGKPCKHGHVACRLTSTGNCVACNLAYQRAWRAGWGHPTVRAEAQAWRRVVALAAAGDPHAIAVCNRIVAEDRAPT